MGIVLEIAGERVFNHKFIESLPCKKTCLNKCDKGHAFSSLQVTKKILGSEHVTIHSDATSRDHKKIADHQISLDGAACLYLGFAPLASEDAQALLDLTINILKELSSFYEESDPIFKSLLSKINSTVTDRAAGMKLYDQKLLEFMKSE